MLCMSARATDRPTFVFDIEVAGFPWEEIDEITRGYLTERARDAEEREAVRATLCLEPFGDQASGLPAVPGTELHPASR